MKDRDSNTGGVTVMGIESERDIEPLVAKTVAL